MCEELAEWQRALSDCRTTIALDHDCGLAYLLASRAAKELGNKKEANNYKRLASKLGCKHD